MKNRFLLSMLLCLMPCVLVGQSLPDSNLINRYYYTGKVWGYLKYFHSEVAKGEYNWDDVLIKTLPRIRLSASEQDFNIALAALIDTAGAMAIPNPPPPVVADSLKYNLDLRWLSDPIFSPGVRSALDTIRSRFRPQSNYYVGQAFTNGNPTFSNDTLFYSSGYQASEEHWLLSLFRYWNIINYFAPDKNLIDQNWDGVLKEFIPKVLLGGDTNYQLAMWELTTRINDSHAVIASPTITGFFGEYYLPFSVRYIEGETVVYKVLAGTIGVKSGDIIRSVNGLDIRAWRDSVRRYAAGSNAGSIERSINSRFSTGPQNSVARLEIENADGRKTVSLTRSYNYSEISSGMLQTTPKWRKIRSADSLTLFGYVDMERLVAADVATMFADLHETDAIIFDIRRYPQDALNEVVRYLFAMPLFNAWYTCPDIQYPGTLRWYANTLWGVNASNRYKNEVRILFNEVTVSAGEWAVMTLEQHRPSMKFGSQTCGADGNVSPIYLPGMIFTGFSGLGIFYPDGRPTQRIGILPDVVVGSTIEGLRQGKDEVLEAALQQKLITSVAIQRTPSPAEQFVLSQNYPNPFNPSTVINFRIPKFSRVSLKVFNVLGQEVAVLLNEEKASGYYQVRWDASHVPSGIYFYRLQAGEFVETKKAILLK